MFGHEIALLGDYKPNSHYQSDTLLSTMPLEYPLWWYPKPDLNKAVPRLPVEIPE